MRVRRGGYGKKETKVKLVCEYDILYIDGKMKVRRGGYGKKDTKVKLVCKYILKSKSDGNQLYKEAIDLNRQFLKKLDIEYYILYIS